MPIRDMRQRVKTALRYPSFVVSAMIGAMLVVNIFVIPQFQKVFASFHAELPLMTRVLIGCAALAFATSVCAQDWPQWRGPNRDNHVTGFTPPAMWPATYSERLRESTSTALASIKIRRTSAVETSGVFGFVSPTTACTALAAFSHGFRNSAKTAMQAASRTSFAQIERA